MAAKSPTKKKSSSRINTARNGSQRTIWHKSAPAAVRKAFSSGDLERGWDALRKHLAERRRPVDPAKLVPGKQNPLDWALPDGFDRWPAPAWLDLVDQLDVAEAADAALQKNVLGWLGEVSGGPAKPGDAMRMLSCAHAMPRLAAVLPSEIWWDLLDQLLATVADAGGIVMEENPLAHQLLAGELPLTLAYLLPEIDTCRKLRSAARRALSAGLIDLLDGEGICPAKHTSLLRPLLACWTRCRGLGCELKSGSWTTPADNQYQWLVRHALRLTRHDGTQAFSAGSSETAAPGLWQAAVQFGGDDDDRDIATLALPGGRKSEVDRISEADLPLPAVRSQWAAVAVLRSRWSRSTAQLTALYDDDRLQTEFACGKEVLWSGQWQADIRLDGRPATPKSEWREVCWISDEDVDYLELEIDLTEGFRLQRQMLLAREDRFLLLADVVLGTRSGELAYRGSLPLVPGITLQGADESREGCLLGRKRRAMAMPLALPEWRADRRVGELAQTDAGLQLTQSAKGHSLYAPLWFDLDRRRMTRRLTWRQLTVAESLAVVPHDVAVGYRVAVGKQQWLIYRSLAERANRTLLGHNLSTEMLVARFESNGEVEPLLEVE